jgi:hypothetical protein
MGFLRVFDGINRSFSTVYNPLSGVGSDVDIAKSQEVVINRRKLQDAELASLYLNSGVMQRIIDIPVDQACECILELKTESGNEDIDPIQDELNETWHFRDLFREASISARIFNEAYLVLDIDDGLDPSEPVDMYKVKGLSNIFFLESGRITPTFSNNRLQRTGYRIISSATLETDGTLGKVNIADFTVIHPDRVLLFCGKKLSPKLQQLNSGYHASIVESISDSYLSLVGSINSANNFLSKLVTFVFKMKGLKNLLLQGAEKAIQDRLRTHKYGVGSVGGIVIDSDNEDVSWLTVPLAGVPDTLGKIEKFFQANAPIPHVDLWNEGSHDTTSSLELVNTQRAVKSFISRYWLDNLQKLTNVVAKKYTQTDVFANLILPEPQLGVAEKTSAKLTQAQTDEIYLRYGVISPDTLQKNRFASDNPFEIDESTLEPVDTDAPPLNENQGTTSDNAETSQPKQNKVTDARYTSPVEVVNMSDLEKAIRELKEMNPTLYEFAIADPFDGEEK